MVREFVQFRQRTQQEMQHDAHGQQHGNQWPRCTLRSDSGGAAHAARLSQFGAVDQAVCKASRMREPYAGDPHVRFGGGEGSNSIDPSYPYRDHVKGRSRCSCATRCFSHFAVSFSAREFCFSRSFITFQSTQSSGWSWLKQENT